MEGKEEPRFVITKKTLAERPGGLTDAWNKHSKAMSGVVKGPGGISLLALKTYISGKLVESCVFCEHKCKVNRAKKAGTCGVGKDSFVSSAFVHLGEEPELVPSGTIFFSGCNFTCSYCQNWGISQDPKCGYKWAPEMIASWIAGMRNGIANVNLVGGEPTPHLHNILGALLLLDASIPVVWNSNMYMSGEAMDLLDGIVDVYLADFKYGNDECAKELSGARNYFSVVSRNHLLAQKSAELLIRHLVLPGHVECCSKPILRWVRDNLGPSARLNIMGQYKPEYKASGKIKGSLGKDCYVEVLAYANGIGLKNLEPIGCAKGYLDSE